MYIIFDKAVNVAVLTLVISLLVIGIMQVQTKVACSAEDPTCCCETRSGGLCCKKVVFCSNFILGCNCK